MRFDVLVKTGSKKNEVIEGPEGELIVRTTVRAHDGEANKAIIQILAKHFKVGKTRVKIVSGEKSKRKIIEIF